MYHITVIFKESVLWWSYSLSNVHLSHSFPSNGLYDPWSSGGVLKPLTPTSSVVAMPIGRGGHQYDLRSSHPGDTEEVKAARKQEVEIIKSWLGTAPVSTGLPVVG